MLGGFFVSSVSSVEEAQSFFREASNLRPLLDFVLLDEQSETRADELCRYLHEFPGDPFRDTKIIHLFTPTTDSLTGHSTFADNTPGVVRMTKPPRKARLLQMLAVLKNPDQKQVLKAGAADQADEQQALEARTLYGNVLIAEGTSQSCCPGPLLTFGVDNPVAQKLLIKQLERFDLNVIATFNGEEAIAGTWDFWLCLIPVT